MTSHKPKPGTQILAKYTAGVFVASVYKLDRKKEYAVGDIIRIKAGVCSCRCEHCWQKVQINIIRLIGKESLLHYVEKL